MLKNRSFAYISLAAILAVLALAMHFFGLRDSLDTKFYYSALDARKLLTGLNSGDLRIYIRTELIDLGFIGAYTALFLLWARHLYAKKSLGWIWALVPGLFDLIETVTILQLLQSGNLDHPPGWLGIVTCLKWSSGAFVALALARRAMGSASRKERSNGDF